MGKNYYQWQLMLMLPLGLECQLYKDEFFIRLEVVPGIVGNRYQEKSFASREAHAAGIWFIISLNEVLYLYTVLNTY